MHVEILFVSSKMRSMVLRNSGIRRCVFNNVRVAVRKTRFICKATLHDESYKYSDHVVYTDKFWNNVKTLDRLWLKSMDVDPWEVHIDGVKLIDMIEKKYGRKYFCSLIYSCEENAYKMIVGEHYFIEGDIYEDYLIKMQSIVERLRNSGVTSKEIYAGINKGGLVSEVNGWWVIVWKM